MDQAVGNARIEATAAQSTSSSRLLNRYDAGRSRLVGA